MIVNIIETIGLTFLAVVAIPGIIFVVFFLTFCIISGIDKLIIYIRKKKHPMYFINYEAGMESCINTSSKFNYKVDRFKHRVEVLTEGLKDGECTPEYFKASFEPMIDNYIEAVEEFKNKQHISDTYFKAADEYAKEHNLKWGIIYD